MSFNCAKICSSCSSVMAPLNEIKARNGKYLVIASIISDASPASAVLLHGSDCNAFDKIFLEERISD